MAQFDITVAQCVDKLECSLATSRTCNHTGMGFWRCKCD